MMVSLEESLRLFGSYCHKKSSHSLGLLSLRRVKTKNANEDSGIAKSSYNVIGKVWFGASSVQAERGGRVWFSGRSRQWAVGIAGLALRMRKKRGRWSKGSKPAGGLKPGQLPPQLGSVHGRKGSRSSGLAVDWGLYGKERVEPETE